MARVRSKYLVIDASVARAAGPEDAVHPTAKRCRDFLLAVLDICHRAVLSESVADEWRKHQSGFARQWRLSMFARKKIDRPECPVLDKFRKDLAQAATSDKQREAMLKDAHLIEAALTQGMRVAALDDTVRDYFRMAAVSVKQLSGICWVNPVNADEEPLNWLRAGAPTEQLRRLGHEVAK